MALKIYYQEDVLNILRSTFVASEGTAAVVTDMLHDPDLQEVPMEKLLQIYRRGFHTALGAIGLAFGLDAYQQERRVPSLSNKQQGTLGTEQVHQAGLPQSDLINFLLFAERYQASKIGN